MAEENRKKEKQEFIEYMYAPKFCLAGEANEAGLIALPIDEPLDDNPNDKSHPHQAENSLNPEQLRGPVKTLAQANWSWKVKKKNPDISTGD